MPEEKDQVEVTTDVELPVEVDATPAIDMKVVRKLTKMAKAQEDPRVQQQIDNKLKEQEEIEEQIKDTSAPDMPSLEFVQLKERLPNNKHLDRYALDLPIGAVCVINQIDYANAVFLVEEINQETKQRTGKIATAREHQFRRL